MKLFTAKASCWQIVFTKSCQFLVRLLCLFGLKIDGSFENNPSREIQRISQAEIYFRNIEPIRYSQIKTSFSYESYKSVETFSVFSRLYVTHIVQFANFSNIVESYPFICIFRKTEVFPQFGENWKSYKSFPFIRQEFTFA